MMFKLCPACRYVNDPEATRCEDCGAALGSDGPAAAAAAKAHAVPPPVELTLRDVLTPQPASTEQRRSARARAGAGGSSTDGAKPRLAFPTLHDLLLPVDLPAEPPANPAAEPPATHSADPAPSEPQAHAARAEARATRRAAVRRSRLQADAPAVGQFVPEVLVLDRDARARDTLGGLLRLFGFGVIGVAEAGRAAALLAERPFTAVFADIALDGADGGRGIELCRRLRETATPSMRVLVSAPLNAVDRVRAQLLGFDGMLAKPVQRGDVARVLDAHGVALPSDPRRH